jgi:hypothetical protein
MEKYPDISTILSAQVWCGRTSGGYGNGPYRKSIFIGDRPDDRVLDSFGDCDVTETWKPAKVSDITNWHDLNRLGLHRAEIQRKLETATPGMVWFWHE